MALGDLGSTDIFSLGAGFHAQNTEVSNEQDIVDVLASDGDIACKNGFNTQVTVTAEYEVCGSVTLAIDLGSVVGGYIVRSVELSHEAGAAPRVSIEGIKYGGSETVSEQAYAISQAVNIASVASGLTTPASGIEATSVTRRWECEISTAMGPDGEVSYAVTRTPVETYEESGSGTLASAPTMTGYTLSAFANSDSNQELDTYSCSFEKGLVTT
jgi:hypothetical protein